MRLSADGSARTETRALWAHHDFVELPDGTLCWNGYEFADLVIDEKTVPTAVDTIVCAPEGSTSTDDATVVWTQLDPKQWPYPFRVVNETFLPGYNEYAHGNSLAYLPEDDSFLVMFRWIDTIAKISRDGELQWVFGGPDNAFTVTKGAASAATGTEADIFLQAHFSDAWYDDDGLLHILVFDNQPRPGPSRIGEYVLDEEADTYRLDWSYASDTYENLLGDVRRMPVEGCDHLMVSFSTQGRLVEMTRAGDIVWDVGLRSGAATTRLTLLPDLYDMSGTAYP